MRDNKQEQISEIAAELISTEGYKGTSLQKIADKVGVHKSTLFHYIKSKKDLLVHILEQSGDTLAANLERLSGLKELEPEEKLRVALENHLSSVIEDIGGLNVYLHEMKALPPKYRKIYTQKRKNYEKYFESIVTEMKERGFFEGLDTKLVTFGILGMLNSVPRWYRPEGRFTIKEVSDILYKMVVGKGKAEVDG
jgi:TetR/AcrR family transcriptional regulator, cholesterol catabolism regulator